MVVGARGDEAPAEAEDGASLLPAGKRFHPLLLPFLIGDMYCARALAASAADDRGAIGRGEADLDDEEAADSMMVDDDEDEDNEGA